MKEVQVCETSKKSPIMDFGTLQSTRRHVGVRHFRPFSGVLKTRRQSTHILVIVAWTGVFSRWHQRPVVEIQQHVGQIFAVLAPQIKGLTAFPRHQPQSDRAHAGCFRFGLIQHF